MESVSSSPPNASPLHTPEPVPTSSPVTTGTILAVSSAPPVSLSAGDDPDEHVLVLSDDNGSVYTTTIYSTRDPPSPISSTPANIHQIGQSTPNFAAIMAGVGGGVGLLLLLVGVIWCIWVRRAKRRASVTLIKDRKFFPDRYNQTMTSNRHSEFNETDPGPVVVQPPPPYPPPSPLLHHLPTLSCHPLSRQTTLYQNHITPPTIHGNWTGTPSIEGILEDAPPFARQRIPYPSSPVQPLVDRYTVIPSRSTSVSNSPVPLRLPLNPPPQYPNAYRSPSATHRRYHSHQSYHNRPPYQGYDLERDSYFTPTPTPHPSPPVQMRAGRRYTVLVSPPLSPSFFTLPSPRQDLPVVKTEPSKVALKSRPSVNFSSANSLVMANEAMNTKRMMLTNPDSDIDLETDTETEGACGSGSGGSPSATDIIRLYSWDQDQDTSPASSVLEHKDSPTVPINSVPASTESS